jgi:deoxyribose-phosphate aldolase
MNLAKYIDHTLLKADAKPAEIARLCREAKEKGFASVCVNPCWVEKCAGLLKGSAVKVCTVIGFPLGATSTFAKVEEALQAVDDGAEELDVVVNQGLLKSDAFACFYDLKPIVDEWRAVKKGLKFKLILECCNLTDEEKIVGCNLAMRTGFDYVKTSTGFGKGGASVEDVALMRRTVGKRFGVKAAGGIRDRETALAMIKAGATRIGTSAGCAIMGK